MKKFLEKASSFVCRYINGTKGAISLFLAFLMTPILSLSLLLVESSRYQSIIQLMEELQDLCGFSTLSNYDSYMEERFGLLSIDQEKDIELLFEDYLDSNVGLLGNSVSLLNSTTAKGDFPLSDSRVLRQQIVEYGELSVLTKTVYEGLDINDLLDSLMEKFDFLDQLNETIELLQVTSDLGSTLTKLLKNCKELYEAHTEYTSALSAYRAAYSSTNDNGEPIGFAQDVLNLVTALQNAEANLGEDDDPDDVWDDEEVKDAIDALEDSEANYRSKASTLMSKISALRDKASALNATLASLGEKINKFNNEPEKTGDSKTYDVSAADWTLAIATEAYNKLVSAIPEEFVDLATGDIDELQNQITLLNSLKKTDFENVASSWTLDNIKNTYGPIQISFSSFGNIIKTVMDDLDSDVDTGEDSDMLSTLLDLVDCLFNIQLWYDQSLDSVVSSDSLYQTVALEETDSVLITSINVMATAAQTFEDAMAEGGVWKVIKIIEAMAEVIASVAVFLAAVVTWIGEFVAGVASTLAELSDPNDLYNQLLMFGYCAYNMPNRVTCTTGKALTGYSYQKIFLMNGGNLSEYDSQTLGGSFFDSLPSSADTDTAFKGAVQEYLMVGSNSEYVNQFNAFVKIYLFRLALNLPLVLTDAEWALSGPFAIVIKILLALAEPLLDAVFLVNGQSENLIKDKLYISPSGATSLLKKLVNITQGKALASVLNNEIDKGSEENKDENNDSSKDAEDGGDDDDDNGTKLFSCNYGDHLYILAFIMCDEVKYLERLKNVIQMEAVQYYRSNSGYDFELDEAYTYVYSTVDYKINPIFSLDLLTNGGVFDVASSRYSGY